MLTWGMFPGREIIQTTFVGVDSFDIWKKEAFSIWQKGWIAKLNNTPNGSQALAVLQHMMQSYYLVNIVDNDLARGNLFHILLKDL